MKLPTAQEMQALDKCAIEEFGIPGIVLMENAGVGTVRAMQKYFGDCENTFACVFVGPGNNGGDGLVIGRHLHQLGCNPIFFFLVNPDKLKGDAATNLAIIKKMRLPFHVIDTDSRVQTIPVLFKQIESRGMPCYTIVDAVFGTGLARNVGEHYATAINLINERSFGHHVPVVSVDCPSGMNADSGKIHGSCIRADLTATYGFAKPGHFIHDSRELTGQLEVIDIGIPPEALDRVPASNSLIDKNIIQEISNKISRKHSAHKGNNGHLLILAGSTGKTGAAMLSGIGALRGGCGLVSLAVPADLNPIIESNLIEAMTIPLSGTDTLTCNDTELILAQMKGKDALVIGPGIGTTENTARLALSLYRQINSPMVVDADALNILSENRDVITEAEGVRIFTPHPGELSRLIGWETTKIQENRLEAALTACAAFNNDTSQNIVILKGAGTIIAAPGQTTLINTSGNPGMATGGMGDVLCGIIGALLCQGLEPLAAAAAGVFIHGAAADRLYERFGPGYTASEVAHMVPETIKSLQTE